MECGGGKLLRQKQPNSGNGRNTSEVESRRHFPRKPNAEHGRKDYHDNSDNGCTWLVFRLSDGNSGGTNYYFNCGGYCSAPDVVYMRASLEGGSAEVFAVDTVTDFHLPAETKTRGFGLNTPTRRFQSPVEIGYPEHEINTQKSTILIDGLMQSTISVHRSPVQQLPEAIVTCRVRYDTPDQPC